MLSGRVNVYFMHAHNKITRPKNGDNTGSEETIIP